MTAALPPLFASLPEVFAARYDAGVPWSLLGEALDELLGDRVAIDETARIHTSAVIEGPVFVGRGAEVRPGAYIRGGVWIGDRCVVGTNTEIKRAILLPHAKAPHLNYVGDSILGADVNLGAGTILSNFRHDGAAIQVRVDGTAIDTGRRKLGAILGDRVLTGCNAVLHPGVIVGRGTQIYPGVQLRSGAYPENSIVKLRQDIEVVART